ncbi:MAG: SH3 domain-containing protein, partial [Thiobacillaceae bacterium]|nr:SH3 domain-containing protein [Thiobacillaceae bacterium]
MKPRIALFCACLLATPAFAAPGVMLKDDELKATASAAAASLGRVAKGASVEILARQGGWTQVTSAGKTGWVRILAVKSSAPAAGAGDVLGLVQAGTSKRDPGKVVAVAGLRGL